jgi:hypothetical protein
MRFFDADNTRFEKTFGVAAIIVVLYVGSYVYIRRDRTSYDERDGCPPSGCEIVSLYSGAFYYFYNPLIHFDRYWSYSTWFEFE